MARRQKHLLLELADLPWWVGVGVAALVFVGLKFIFPAIAGTGLVAQAMARSFSQIAWIFAMPFLIAAVVSVFRQFSRRRLLNDQTSLDSIRALSWQDFERLVGQAFRQQGYVVEEVGGGGADGGVDLRLRKDGRTTVVQCKRWKEWKVGAPLVRELYGVMHAAGADEAIFVSSGKYTNDAHEFAGGKPIQLIDGRELLTMIRAVQQSPNTHRSSPIT